MGVALISEAGVFHWMRAVGNAAGTGLGSGLAAAAARLDPGTRPTEQGGQMRQHQDRGQRAERQERPATRRRDALTREEPGGFLALGLRHRARVAAQDGGGFQAVVGVQTFVEPLRGAQPGAAAQPPHAPGRQERQRHAGGPPMRQAAPLFDPREGGVPPPIQPQRRRETGRDDDQRPAQPRPEVVVAQQTVGERNGGDGRVHGRGGRCNQRAVRLARASSARMKAPQAASTHHQKRC